MVKTSTQKRLIFHSIALAHHAVAVAFLESLDIKPKTSKTFQHFIDSKLLFFSGWNFALQVIFLAIALACDIIKFNLENHKKIWVSHALMARVASCRDFLFTTFVMPFSILVSVIFWVTYYIDREMIMPKDWDFILPPFVNHAFHSTTILILALEMFVATKDTPDDHKPRLACLSTLTFFYFMCFLGSYFATGQWIYVLFSFLSWKQRIFAMSSFYVSANILYFAGWHLIRFAEKFSVNIKKSYKE